MMIVTKFHDDMNRPKITPSGAIRICPGCSAPTGFPLNPPRRLLAARRSFCFVFRRTPFADEP